ncbi:MAG: hypothetical protein SF097_06660 [Acidobacteriota bacterium]|nr:hypothetical protein [Acidobacteriota bacterium]
MRMGRVWLLLALLFTINAPFAGGQEPTIESSPTSVARGMFTAMQKQDWKAFASHIDPADLERLKQAVIYLFQAKQSGEALHKLRSRFAPYNSDSVGAATGAELLQAAMHNEFAEFTNVGEYLAGLKLQILGQIEESPDKVHVITRLEGGIYRAEAVTCVRRDGQWRAMLKEEMNMITNAIEGDKFARSQNQSPKSPKGASSGQGESKMTSDVVGWVKESDSLVQVLCRTSIQVNGYNSSMLRCYPLEPTDEAWAYLGNPAKFREVYRRTRLIFGNSKPAQNPQKAPKKRYN